MDYGQIIYRTADDSYVITKDGMPYHVYPYAAEFAGEWDAVFAYAEAHPECVTEEEPYEPPVPTLEEMKAAKLSESNAAADRAISKLTATYPNREISTFDKQESEARAYAADPTASTPLLSALAEHGAFLCPTLWRGYSPRPTPLPWLPSIIGQRQALEDRLDACTTLEEVQGIVVDIVMPGGEKHDLRKANPDRPRSVHQRLARRLAGRNPVLALLPLGAGRGEGMAPARGGRAVLLAEGTLQEQLREREMRTAVTSGTEK